MGLGKSLQALMTVALVHLETATEEVEEVVLGAPGGEAGVERSRLSHSMEKGTHAATFAPVGWS